MLNIIIVGAGPTGVELSGAFAEIKKYVLPKDFQRIDFSRLRVILPRLFLVMTTEPMRVSADCSLGRQLRPQHALEAPVEVL